MKKTVLALAVSTALSTATSAYAQTQDVPPPATTGDTTRVSPPVQTQEAAPPTTTTDTTAVGQPEQDGGAALDDIVVTARRGAENLQNVPVSVQVVSGDSIQKLAITTADEISKLAPGLTLTNRDASTQIVLRGVAWQPGSGTPATPIYFNEAPFDPQATIQSIFDVGQIEVLRGPQGTSRGAPSISGAVTITTRKPDLSEFGGYVQGFYGSGDRTNVQGALNIPIIRDVLAIRFAANLEDSDGTRIRSVNSTVDPRFKDRTYRASLLFQPTDTISIGAMYQRRKTDRINFTQVAGTGSPGFPALGIPANFNGPALDIDDNASVQSAPGINREHIDLLTVNASWEVFGHTLSANYGRNFNRTGPIFIPGDFLNILPGFEPYFIQSNVGRPKFWTREIRISSLPDSERPFDYDIGWFSKTSEGTINYLSPIYLPGAFGAPFQSVPGQVTTPRSRYILNASSDFFIRQQFDSFYGNIRFHVTDNTELSGGLAIIRDSVPVRLDITTSAATIALPTFLPPPAGCQGISAFLPVSADYGPGYCEAAIPAATLPPQVFNNRYSDALYSFSISHKFTDDLLVYATTGSSFRTGLPAINNPGLPDNLVVPAPERAKSYEIGVKASFGRRLRINGAIFQLDYEGQLTAFEGINYFNTVTNQLAQTSLAFFRNIDSRVRGAEVEFAVQPLDNLSLGVNVSYSKIKSKGGTVPCNIGPAVTAANPINTCPTTRGETLNVTPPFQVTGNGSYTQPLTDWLSGYFRFNANYQGRNPNYGNFRVGDSFRPTGAYAIVDLFAGVSATDSAWELGVYAKNVFDKQAELARIATANTVFPLFAAPSGYDVVRLSAQREIGVSLRWSFGSR